MRLSETCFWANLSLKIRRSRCDWSVKEPFTGEWKAKVRTKIRSVDQVIVFCGEHTHTATGVSAELMKPRRKKTLLPAVGILRQNLRETYVCLRTRQDLQMDVGQSRPRCRIMSTVPHPDDAEAPNQRSNPCACSGIARNAIR